MEMGEPPKLRKLSSTKIVKTKNVPDDDVEDHGGLKSEKSAILSSRTVCKSLNFFEKNFLDRTCNTLQKLELYT